MARRNKQRGPKSRRSDRSADAYRPDPLEDVFAYGGELIYAVGFTPGGLPFGPRVEIVDGELRFPDEEPTDLEAED